MIWAEPGIIEHNSPPSRCWFAVGSMDQSTAGRETEIADRRAHADSVEQREAQSTRR